MNLNYSNGVACKDSELRYVGMLDLPDPWAYAYNWGEQSKGIIEGPSGRREYFTDEKRVKFILDAWEKAKPMSANNPHLMVDQEELSELQLPPVEEEDKPTVQ